MINKNNHPIKYPCIPVTYVKGHDILDDFLSQYSFLSVGWKSVAYSTLERARNNLSNNRRILCALNTIKNPASVVI